MLDLLPLRLCHSRAKNIKNQAVVNEDADQRTLLRKYERELRKLRAELTRRNKELVDKRHLLEVRACVSPRSDELRTSHRTQQPATTQQPRSVCYMLSCSVIDVYVRVRPAVLLVCAG